MAHARGAAPGADPRCSSRRRRARAIRARAETLLREGLTRAPDDVAVRVELRAACWSRAGGAEEALPLADETVAASAEDAARRWRRCARRWPPPAVGARRWRRPRRRGRWARRRRSRSAWRWRWARGSRRRWRELAGRQRDGAGRRGDAGGAARVPRGTAGEDDRIALARLAPDEASRRFVARPALAAPPGRQPGRACSAGRTRWRRARRRWSALAPAAARALEAFDRPLLVAVMGEFNAGKSSFVNALCGDEVAPTGVTPTTATINVLRHGERAGARRPPRRQRASRCARPSRPRSCAGLRDEEAAAIRSVDIFLPARGAPPRRDRRHARA